MSPSCWSGSKVNRKKCQVSNWHISHFIYTEGKWSVLPLTVNVKIWSLLPPAQDWVSDKSHHWMFVQEEFIWAKYTNVGLIRMHMSHLEKENTRHSYFKQRIRWSSGVEMGKLHCNNCILDFTSCWWNRNDSKFFLPPVKGKWGLLARL